MRRLMITIMLVAAASLGLLTPATAGAAPGTAPDAGFTLVTKANAPRALRNAVCCTITSSANGHLVSAELAYKGGDNGMLRARELITGDWEKFTLTATGSSWSILSVANNRYVAAEIDYGGGDYAMLRARSTAVDAWEKFDLYYNATEEVYAFKSVANGLWVAAEIDYRGGKYAELRARSSAIGTWEKFKLGNY